MVFESPWWQSRSQCVSPSSLMSTESILKELYLAVAEERVDDLRALLSVARMRSVDLEHRFALSPSSSVTLLLKAIRTGSVEIVELLLQQNVALNAPLHTRNSCIHIALEHGHVKVLMALIERLEIRDAEHFLHRLWQDASPTCPASIAALINHSNIRLQSTSAFLAVNAALIRAQVPDKLQRLMLVLKACPSSMRLEISHAKRVVVDLAPSDAVEDRLSHEWAHEYIVALVERFGVVLLQNLINFALLKLMRHNHSRVLRLAALILPLDVVSAPALNIWLSSLKRDKERLAKLNESERIVMGLQGSRSQGLPPLSLKACARLAVLREMQRNYRCPFILEARIEEMNELPEVLKQYLLLKWL